MAFNLDAFVRGYMVAALWSSHGPEEEPFACENLDDIFGVEDIAPATAEEMRSDCEDFAKANATDLAAYCERIRTDPSQGTPEDYAGHDFWLTRNRHGAGFWDRGLGDLGERLSAAARVYGSVDLYPGDDGKVY